VPGLTAHQSRLLTILKEAKETPSYEEMKAMMGLKSKSGIHRLISALEERGFIERCPNRARAVRVLDEPRPFERPTPKPPSYSVRHIPSDILIAELRARGVLKTILANPSDFTPARRAAA
jgi:SOS-response transcriptional repressor LexA